MKITLNSQAVLRLIFIHHEHFPILRNGAQMALERVSGDGRDLAGRAEFPKRYLEGITMDMSLSKLQETVKVRGAWRAADHGVTNSHTRLSN